MRDQISTRLADVSKTVTENYAETNQRLLDAVVENSRKAADFYVKTADQVAEQLPTIDLPFEVPTPSQAAERYLELVERVVEMNRDFSERIVNLNREYTDRVVAMLRADDVEAAATAKTATKPANKRATRTSPKRTATKPAARKSTTSTAKKATAKRATAKKATASK